MYISSYLVFTIFKFKNNIFSGGIQQHKKMYLKCSTKVVKFYTIKTNYEIVIILILYLYNNKENIFCMGW